MNKLKEDPDSHLQKDKWVRSGITYRVAKLRSLEGWKDERG